MNYLAHLALAQNTPASKAGNLLGDFMKGIRLDSLPTAIQNGVLNHRLTDQFTDRHSEVVKLKSLFPKHTRRFAGIALDIGFDHCLSKNWKGFYEISLANFISPIYDEVLSQEAFLPANMIQAIKRFKSYGLLESYIEEEGVIRAIEGLANRIRFENPLMHTPEVFLSNYNVIEPVFLAFFEELRSEIKARAIEKV